MRYTRVFFYSPSQAHLIGEFRTSWTGNPGIETCSWGEEPPGLVL